MERIVVAVLVAVDGHVGRAGEEKPTWRQQPAHHGDQGVLLLDVFQCLETGDDVEAVRSGEQLGIDHRSEPELQLVPGIVGAGVFHGLRIDVDAYHVAGSGDEQSGSEALPASEVQHPRASGEPSGQCVPVVVLVDDLQIVGPRHATFAGPLDAAIAHWNSPHVRLVSRCRIGERPELRCTPCR